MSEPTFKDFKQAKADAESRLAPCPWCGGGGEILFGHIAGAGPTIYVECLNCGARIHPVLMTALKDPIERTVEKWNKRKGATK